MTAGRSRIDEALDALYPSTRDHRMGLRAAPGEGIPPLDEIVAYRSLTPVPHWHYVGYGLSELGAKVSDDLAHSGFGIELTMRLVDDSETPPMWPFNLLRWLAGLVQRDRNPFGDGHSLPITDILESVSPGVGGLAFAVDHALGTLATSNGNVTFLQIVPLTPDEYTLMGRWDAVAVFAELRRVEPSLLWRIGRTSILAGDRGRELEERAARDGSSQEVDFTGDLEWNDATVWLDALNRQVILKFLRYRVAYGRGARIHSDDLVMTLEAGPLGLAIDDDTATLSVPAARATALATQLAASGSNTLVTFDGVPLFRLGDMGDVDAP